MSSRETILGRIRTAISDRPKAERPEMPALWPNTNPSTDQLVERFLKELHALNGEFFRCSDMAAARKRLAEVLGSVEGDRLGAADRGIVRELLADIDDASIEWGDVERTAVELAELSTSVVSAEYLLADTGSAMVVGDTPHNRMMCYVPPVCIVIARTDQLREHMPAAWGDVVDRAKNPDLRGEFVFITGPSRTADIEKILILGVHGPKRVIVIVVDA